MAFFYITAFSNPDSEEYCEFGFFLSVEVDGEERGRRWWYALLWKVFAESLMWFTGPKYEEADWRG